MNESNKCEFIKSNGIQCKRYNRIDGLCNMHYKKRPIDCSICFSTIKDKEKCILKCSHAFHNLCIHKWYTKSNTCPNCRETFDKTDVKLKLDKIFNMKKRGRGFQFLISYEGSEEQIWVPGKTIQEHFITNNSLKIQ